MTKIKKTQKSKKFDRIILVTGGMGFIGSNYLNTAVIRYPNYFFINLDCLTYAANPKNVYVADKPNYIFRKADIRNPKALEKIFSEFSPTDIIHFAAESHVDKSIVSPHDFIETNVHGTHNLLHLAKTHNINRFHHISTDEIYGSLGTKGAPFRESTAFAPNSPYSASKAAADLLVRSYNKTYGLNTVITRCSNNYGPHQDESKLIPLFITRLLKNKKVPLYGKGAQVRDWLYVDDHVQAIDLVFHKGKSGEAYNVGGKNSEKTNLEITNILLKLLGKNNDLIEYVADRPGHDFRYSIDFSKITKELGWQPKVSFEDGIKKTIEYYSTLYKLM